MITQVRERVDNSGDPSSDPGNGAAPDALSLTAEEWAQEQEWRAWRTGYLSAPDPDRYAGSWPAPVRPERLIGSRPPVSVGATGWPTAPDSTVGRARDDFLVSSWSGLLVPRPVPVPGQGVLVGRGARVYGPDGDVGTLERVLVDPDTDEVRGLVIRRAEPGTRPLRVPASWVRTAGAAGIVLAWCPDNG